MPSTAANPEPAPAALTDDERGQYVDNLNKLWSERQAQRQAGTAPTMPQPQAQPAPDPYAGMSGDLAKALRSFEATMKAREAHKAEEESAADPQQPTAVPEVPEVAQLIMFPQWGDERRAAAAAIFRSALFPPLNFKQSRPYLEKAQIYATKGIEIYFTGKQFDQSDLDVYLELLHIAREVPFGVECCFTAYSLLKRLGRATGKANHEWLHSVLIRLRGGTVDMTDHKIRYFGGLIEGGFKDEITNHYRVRLNPDMARLFRGDLWASLDIQQRRDLGRSQTAKALQAYYATHADPGPHRYETLAAIIGLKNTSNPRKLKADLIKAHGLLKEVGSLANFEAGTKTITPKVNRTPSQTRHLMRRATAGAGKANATDRPQTKED